MQAIVTVKMPRDPKHDPRNKKVGTCPLFKPPFTPFKLQGSFTCTDMTGEHHSYLETGDDIDDIQKKAAAKFKHITRVEEI